MTLGQITLIYLLINVSFLVFWVSRLSDRIKKLEDEKTNSK